MGDAVTCRYLKSGEQRVRAAPATPGSPVCIPFVPWLVTWVLLLPLPFCLTNAYTQFVVNIDLHQHHPGRWPQHRQRLRRSGDGRAHRPDGDRRLRVRRDFHQAGFPFWVALPAAMLVTALGRRDCRHPVASAGGAYLALATLGLAEFGSHRHFRHRLAWCCDRLRGHSAALSSAARRSATIAPTTTS